MTTLRAATWPADSDVARELFREYAAELGMNFCFQGFEQELAGLPGKYAPPLGELLLAETHGEPAGCVAMRPLDDGVCEMKRMYVRPAQRGAGLGRRLASRIVEIARERGYALMRLDTLSSMTPAMSLYRSLGFVECSAYYHNPLPNVVYLQCAL